MDEQEEHPFDRANRKLCEELGATSCQFCGGMPRITGGGANYWTISCRSCNASSGLGRTDASAVEAWSRRATPSPSADLTAAREEIGRLRVALSNCMYQFLAYEQQHLAKSPPDYTKAKTNKDFAELASTALAGGAPDASDH